MELKRLIKDDSAVSPVIGVILMVAITVILAAVIATFVFGLSDQVSTTTPQVQFSFDYEEANENLSVVHDGGDKVERNDISFRVSGGNGSVNVSSAFPNADVTAGDSATLSDVQSSETVRVVWRAGEGSSGTLGKWTGPDA